MIDLYEELRRVIEALDAASISYALIGGLAVSIYTAPRATEDVDPLRTAAQLRTLCLRLPHAPTPAERAELARFAEIASWPRWPSC